MAPTPLGDVAAAVGHEFSDCDLLERALTHSSYTAENAGAVSYERLEFLGDAVLEFVTTQMIFESMPDMPEGAMTKMRAAVVDERTLASIAGEWGLSDALRLGVGEDRAGGRHRTSILSDAVEAVVAAVFLDGGTASADRVIRATWAPVLEERLGQQSVADPRSALQELLAKRGDIVEFAYQRTGPDHAAVFTAIASVDGAEVGSGTGGSKKAAAIAAASNALERGV